MPVGSTRRVPAPALVMLAAVVAGIDARAQRPAPARPAATRPAASAAAGEAVTRKVCGTACHSFEHVITVGRTRAQWEATIENMIGRGAKATSAEVAALLDFLSSTRTLSATTIRGGV